MPSNANNTTVAGMVIHAHESRFSLRRKKKLIGPIVRTYNSKKPATTRNGGSAALGNARAALAALKSARNGPNTLE